MNSLRVETHFPCAVSLGTVGVASICVRHLPCVPEPLATATITLGVVVAGFTATQRNMLVGMKGLPLFNTIAKTGHDADLTLYLKQCLWSCIALILVSGTRFFLEDLPPVLTPIWTIVWFGTFAFVIASTCRNERFMFRIIGKFLSGHKDLPPTPNSNKPPNAEGLQVTDNKGPDYSPT